MKNFKESRKKKEKRKESRKKEVGWVVPQEKGTCLEYVRCWVLPLEKQNKYTHKEEEE